MPSSSAKPKTWANQLHLHWLADEPDQGLEIWQQACQSLAEPQLPYLNHGNILRDLNRFEAADHAYGRAYELASTQADKHSVAWNHSQLLIGLENYNKAYELAEQRFQLPHHKFWRQGPYFQPWPLREAASNDLAFAEHRLTIWTEQGFGDCLQYLRWIVPLIEMGCRVRLEVEPPLLPLLREGLSWLGSSLSITPKGIGPRALAYPCQGSLLSLPWLLGGAPLAAAFQNDATGAAQPLGYLRSAHWPSPGARRQRRPRIGLVWASGRKQDDDFIQREYERRSLPATVLLDLLNGLEAAGAELICLQFGPDRQRAESWRGSFAASLADGVSLADNARWISALDLVITVDTATAHLVGAMAKPGWVLLPWGSDPRWLRDRQDSPWYPSLTLLRQPRHRDWEGLVQRVLKRFQLWRDECFAHDGDGSGPRGPN